MVEPVRDPGQVADAVAVAVLERARVDLVDDAVLPPGRGRVGQAGGPSSWPPQRLAPGRQRLRDLVLVEERQEHALLALEVRPQDRLQPEDPGSQVVRLGGRQFVPECGLVRREVPDGGADLLVLEADGPRGNRRPDAGIERRYSQAAPGGVVFEAALEQETTRCKSTFSSPTERC